MKPAGVILAAGQSSRMGSDKALLPYAGSTFLDHAVDLFLRHVAPVIVVLGRHADQIRAALPDRAGLVVVVNERWAAGQLSSLQAGLRALPAEAPGALVTLVDHPAVAESTVYAMAARCDAPLAIPRYQGRRGHPVWFGRRIVEEILALPVEASAKQVVRAHQNEAVYLDVDDPGVLRDVDTPADYDALLSGGSGAKQEPQE